MKKILFIFVPLVIVLVGCNGGAVVNNGVVATNGNLSLDTDTDKVYKFFATSAVESNHFLGYTWFSGSDLLDYSVDSDISYGIRSENVFPSARSKFSMWRGKDGLIWIYGGQEFSNSSVQDSEYSRSDLWNYDPLTKTWALISGVSHRGVPANPVYGVRGVSAVLNTPGSISDAYSWTDKEGNLWLFGGINTNVNDDMWKFDVALKQWNWIAGNAMKNLSIYKPVYGALGVESAGNTPGKRFGGTTWTDGAGYLWLFGGKMSGSSAHIGNDVWRFNPVTEMWALMTPASTAQETHTTISNSATATYGILGVESITNTPPGLMYASGWTDNHGNLWLFGGGVHSNNNFQSNSSLWKFNPVNSRWTWVDGSNQFTSYGTTGEIGVESSGNMPGARFGAGSWTDKNGNFWLIGGSYQKFSVASSSAETILADVWRYNPKTNQWALIDRMTDNPIYNTKLVSNDNNSIGARSRFGAVYDSIADSVWIFGGASQVTSSNSTKKSYADLWRINDNSSGSLIFESLPALSTTWSNTLEDIPGHQFGLYGLVLANKSNNRLESISMINTFPNNEFNFDSYRSTCLIKGTLDSIILEPNSSCSLVIHYQPTVLGYTGMLQFSVKANILNSSFVYKTDIMKIPYSSESYNKR